MNRHTKASKKKKWLIAAGIVLGILIGARIYLPFWVTDYVNKVLDDVEGYDGSIEGVNINLYRGAYRINKLKMEKTGDDIPVPFVDIATIDLSVQWEALLHGRIVGEIELLSPEINFVGSAKQDGSTGGEQTGGEADWTKPIKELMPLQINGFTVRNGKITFHDFTSKPKVDLELRNVQGEANNLSNATHQDKDLPSTIHVTATSIGNGQLVADCKANLLKPIPDFDLDAKFEQVSLPDLNNFTEAYAKLDFEKGTFNLYSEMAVADGQLEGYVKPVLTDLKVVGSEEDHSALHALWEVVAGAVIKLVENHPHDQFATKVPIRGDLNEPDTKIWPTIGGVFKNGFIKAFSKNTDNSVSFEDLAEKK